MRFVNSVQQKLLQEFARTGMSVGKLREVTGLEIDRSSMSRKIRGVQPMSLDEADAVASVLGLRIKAVRRKAA